jgi:hypothetical protein
MQGEYRGDFTRDTFQRRNHFARVLMQQGRIQLDADWNEQTAILLHYLRVLAADLIGPCGGPERSFAIDKLVTGGKEVPSDFSIQRGHYYVNGILCENEAEIAYTHQPGHPFPTCPRLDTGVYLAYLDVWERHISWVEEPEIRDVALGGPDTAARAKVVSQVKAIEVLPPLSKSTQSGDFEKFIQDNFLTVGRAGLRARTKPAAESESTRAVDAAAGYRGLKNQLYRVEIHQGTETGPQVTFKWSRDNGCVTFPIITLDGNHARIAKLGRDDSRSLPVNDWVEIMDDDVALRGQSGPLRQVTKVEDRTITLNEAVRGSYNEQSTKHPLLRRWDHSGTPSELVDGALSIHEGDGDDEKEWTPLEEGIQVQFRPAGPGEENNYRSGDYWLIPARPATGDVEWPQQLDDEGKPARYAGGNPIPACRKPHGVEHHYAPLASITFSAGKITNCTPLQRRFQPFARV